MVTKETWLLSPMCMRQVDKNPDKTGQNPRKVDIYIYVRTEIMIFISGWILFRTKTRLGVPDPGPPGRPKFFSLKGIWTRLVWIPYPDNFSKDGYFLDRF